MFSLTQAAKAARVSKATIHRAVKSGKVSAARQEDGSYRIDPAELARAYSLDLNALTSQASETPETLHETVSGRLTETPRNAPETPSETVRLAVMEADLRALKAMVEELRTSRDQWQQQAERATLALAAPARAWWRRLAG